jgi:lipopolysaccharide transport system ATP-binding protein
MSDPIITVENLSKSYVIGRQRSKDDGLRHVLQEAALAPWRWLRKAAGSNGANGNGSSNLPAPRSLHPARSSEEFWALRDVNLEIKQGEVVGIIGRNGAGKSTLLKILSRITEPTAGRIHLKGRVASLLEVGTGFHPELTGRENIFLNGAILGMTRAEIKRKFDEIVAFSEIERFLDTPVKRYSSGMYVRLAFAVAAHLEPEILVVDEVLAVGDAAFQKKCLGKIGSAANQGRTVLFVSHNMAVVAQLCQTAVLLEAGAVVARGSSHQTIRNYLGKAGASPAFVRIAAHQHSDAWGGNAKMQLNSVKLLNAAYESFTVHWKEPIHFEIEFEVKERSSNLYFGLAVTTIQGTDLFGSHHDDDRTALHTLDPAAYRITVNLDNPLRAGIYLLSIGASTAIGGSPIFRVSNAVCFEVLDISIDNLPYPQYEAGPVNGNARWSTALLKSEAARL